MPALPLSDAGPYVAAAYLVFLALILVYVAIMASKLVRIERQVSELTELTARRDEDARVAADDRAVASAGRAGVATADAGAVARRGRPDAAPAEGAAGTRNAGGTAGGGGPVSGGPRAPVETA